jgi:hypothetical protein
VGSSYGARHRSQTKQRSAWDYQVETWLRLCLKARLRVCKKMF